MGQRHSEECLVDWKLWRQVNRLYLDIDFNLDAAPFDENLSVAKTTTASVSRQSQDKGTAADCVPLGQKEVSSDDLDLSLTIFSLKFL